MGTSFGLGVLGLNSDSSRLSLCLGFSAVDLKKLRLSYKREMMPLPLTVLKDKHWQSS